MHKLLNTNILDELKSYTHMENYMNVNYCTMNENTTLDDIDFSKTRGNVKVMQGEILLISEINTIIKEAKSIKFP